jgi:hypothetical protein
LTQPDDPELKQDRRRYPRFNLKLSVEFTIVQEQRRCRATVDNISLAGILLLTDEPLENGTRIVVHLRQRGGEPLDMHAQIVRASVVGEFGVAFVSMSESEIERLTSFVERLT